MGGGCQPAGCYSQNEPRAALSSFNVALCQRWKFIQRTVHAISRLFEPLEQVIRDKSIPAVCGRAVSDLERQLIGLLIVLVDLEFSIQLKLRIASIGLQC